MVQLTRIYTKSGDKGKTALGNGNRVAKNDIRVAAYGTVDETNAVIGVARLHATGDVDAMLARIQNDLFDLGADLCTPGDGSDDNPERPALRITADCGALGNRGDQPRSSALHQPPVGPYVRSGPSCQ